MINIALGHCYITYYGVIHATIGRNTVKMLRKYTNSGINYAQISFITLTPGPNFIKLFTAVSYEFSQLARVFAPGKPFQLSLLFLGEARNLP